MSRKRPDGGGPTWAERQRIAREGEALVDADDATIEARADELGVDPRMLRAAVDYSRGRGVRASR